MKNTKARFLFSNLFFTEKKLVFEKASPAEGGEGIGSRGSELNPIEQGVNDRVKKVEKDISLVKILSLNF
ncbi:MAG: hypothetical protein UR28_C0002G0066 [Candidatus Peregrinibacteria bacterium GW2011_GWF2_33_10]|nr:MAG: hypothetical protein UR28_C0002G0066 [Candidatus Peregrinibacteria bacterium GW2011_GWF2_33_10]